MKQQKADKKLGLVYEIQCSAMPFIKANRGKRKKKKKQYGQGGRKGTKQTRV